MKRQPLTPSHLGTEVSRSSCQQHPLKVKASQLQDLAHRPNTTSGLGLLVIILASTMIISDSYPFVLRNSTRVPRCTYILTLVCLNGFVGLEIIPDEVGSHLVYIFLGYTVASHLQCVIALGCLTVVLHKLWR